MEHYPTYEANSCLASQQIPHFMTLILRQPTTGPRPEAGESMSHSPTLFL
jgi:hypothetical protein